MPLLFSLATLSTKASIIIPWLLSLLPTALQLRNTLDAYCVTLL
jgi:hypothetical protein